MTEACDVRRSRYERGGSHRSITPKKTPLLLFVAECGLLTLPQLTLMSGYTYKQARNHARDLFDAGLVDVIAVPRAALAEPGDENDASLLFGSAPNIYAPNRAGLKMLYDAGLIDQATRDRRLPDYGPKNSLFLSHEIGVRDVRVWLERMARRYSTHKVEDWRDGQECAIGAARPDSWFSYRLTSKAVLVGLVEYDRGTERGLLRWHEKMACYGKTFATGAIKATTGYERARIIVVTPNEARRDKLVQVIEGMLVSSNLPADRFAIGSKAALSEDLAFNGWRVPGSACLTTLVDERFLSGE